MCIATHGDQRVVLYEEENDPDRYTWMIVDKQIGLMHRDALKMKMFAEGWVVYPRQHEWVLRVHLARGAQRRMSDGLWGPIRPGIHHPALGFNIFIYSRLLHKLEIHVKWNKEITTWQHFYHIYFFQFWTIRNFGHLTLLGPGCVTVPGCISWDGIFYCCFPVNSGRMDYNSVQGVWQHRKLVHAKLRQYLKWFFFIFSYAYEWSH